MTPPIRRVLVPTDFSPESDAALALAKTIAAGYGASLLLLHVFEEIGGVFAGDAYAPLPPETRAALLKDARARLTHRLSPEERTRFRATADVIVGASAPKIIDYASQQHVDLIVSCGDLPSNYLDFLVSNLQAPMYHVLGNHCLVPHDAVTGRCSPAIRGTLSVRSRILRCFVKPRRN